MPHPAEHDPPARPLDANEAEELAETLKALASPGRLRVLTALLTRDRTVEQLTAEAEHHAGHPAHHLAVLAHRPRR